MINWEKAYITTGATDTFFVLRVSGYYFSHSGVYPRDNYVMNLGRDFAKAIEKAKTYAAANKLHLNIPVVAPPLQPITRKNRIKRPAIDIFQLPF